MKNLFFFICVYLILFLRCAFALPTGETNMNDIPSFQFMTTVKGQVVGESALPVLKPTNAVLFSKVLEQRIQGRYKNHPELVQSDIKRVFEYRQSHHILGTQKINGQVVYDFYVGVLGYQFLNNGLLSRSFTSPHGGFIFVCVGSETSTITKQLHEIQLKGNPHAGNIELVKRFNPEVNGICLNDKFTHFRNSGYADNFHELGHVLNPPCSHSDINDKCLKPQKQVGLNGTYINNEGEFVNVLSMLRATAYNDQHIDVDKLGKVGYRKVLENIMADPDYDVKHGREFGRIQIYVSKVGIDKFMSVAEPYLPAIL